MLCYHKEEGSGFTRGVMNRRFARTLAAGGALLATCLLLAPTVQAGASVEVDRIVAAQASGTGWVVDKTDNICGLDDARMLSNPAKVDYDRLLRATPEMKKIRSDGIDPNSSKGIQLRTAAVDRVRKACNSVQQSNGYCSVWKSVSHRDGRSISDVTATVLQQL